jgi:four helix bundle protein
MILVLIFLKLVMDKFEMMKRTKKFSVNVFFLVETLPDSKAASNLVYQILKSSSSVAANYRAACRAKSKADFINKIKIVEEEADETLFWLEYMQDVKLVKDEKQHSPLKQEANELVAIFTKTLKTLRNQ